MATAIEMPKLGNTVEECLLTRWRKQKGDSVAAGEIVAEIETDKATFDLPSPVDGSLLETFCAEGDLVAVFTNICVIGRPGESVEEFRPREAAALAPSRPAGQAEASAAAPEDRPARRTGEPPGRIFFSPRARRFAAEHGFYPAGITGSGPGGRVLESDLRELYHASAKPSLLARKKLAEGYEIRGETAGIDRLIRAADLGEPPVKLTGVRERIARRMWESLQLTAQYTLTASADAAGLLALRRKVKAAPPDKGLPDININDMIMFACAKALAAQPELNAGFVDGKLYQHNEIHLGFSCDTPRGLLVPVVRSCEKLTLAELAQKVKPLAGAAASGEISPDDLTGGTFTVSNLGAFGIESFTPILNPPQVALLGVNAIELKPVRKNGAVEFMDRIGLSLTVDHQVIDGATGARFLAVLREKIENIEALAELNL